MIRTTRSSSGDTAERQALRRRVQKMCEWLNDEQWEKCYSLIDPKLRAEGLVNLRGYSKGLEAFKTAYGHIRPWLVRISLHVDAASNKRNSRPFAYAYIIWQDADSGFHMFRERWIKDSGHWFTRVAGLVTENRKAGRAKTAK
jgi:hypothetical protein